MYFLDKELNQKIPMIKVRSTNILFIGYFNLKLYVRFKKSEFVYRYSNINQTLYNELKNAESKGSFLSQKVKKFPRKHPYKKLKGIIHVQ
jgi:hypothetical protein